ncbi:MAG: tRNA (N(6)-L-threonylcarbamoyladenosine(37)-C(2))-methylthiotransferase MtaB [Mogibacterium sp.]|nr:tRNA (N(6)-L-threonylcarbamoyladenosine(37)-C(2))-methylthiotransferase MtaB [Mogibacterium sp.]
MKAAFHTLGCKVNQYETEAIKEAFVSRGAEIVDEDEYADVYVVNTCTVTNMADRKSRQYIRRMNSVNPDAIIVVTGCYAQVAADEVSAMPEVDLVIGNSLKNEIAEKACELYEKRADADASSHVLGYDELLHYEDMGIVTSDESSMCRAYIKIEEGCNRFCSYCLIPYARGRVRSRRPEYVVAEAETLIAKGYKEIILTGINTALYGTEPEFTFDRSADEEGLSGLEVIIKRIDKIDADFRVRLSSLEPTVVDRENVERLIKYEKLCHHLHLSIQSGSNAVLKSMNRHYSRDNYLDIVRMLREYDPLYGITTDIIVGFPGESDTDFEASLNIVKEAQFARVHAFRYSPRKGTKGAELKGRIAGEVSKERAARLETEASETACEFNKKNFGIECRVLAEEEQDGFITGYTDNYIKVYIDFAGFTDDDSAPRLGEFCKVKLTENYKDGCKAVPAE